MNSKPLWAFILILWSFFLLTNHVQGQCSNHSLSENGKNLRADLIRHPPRRWYGTTMDYRVQPTTRFWYGADIAHAAAQWNDSSYKGTSSSFHFNDAGNTNAPADEPDLNNVIGIKELPFYIGAQAHTRAYGNGEIYECDISINSIHWTHIQPHSLAGNSDYCVRNALCQEFGHALGLKDLKKSVYAEDTMYYKAEPGEHKKEDLECDDKWGTYWLYDSGRIRPPTAPSVEHFSQKTLDLTRLSLEKGAIPAVTELVGNYPNPFNPETWIAYMLAQESEVSINIYDAEGQVVRLLQLGRKTAGVYVEQSDAAYWDGRRDTGTPVSSGIYFYSLITDSAIYTKRMVILK